MKYIELTQGQRATVDDRDYDRVSQHKWCALWDAKRKVFIPARTWRSGGKQKTVLLSRFVVDAPDGIDVDHRDHDTLNATRENLRRCTTSQNLANAVKCRMGTSSKYKGVLWLKSRNRWQARINCNNHRITLGNHRNEKDAALAYDRKARELFGDFALTNF